MTRKSPRSRKGDYEVGYGRPPKATRFKPGQSGYPKGRPRQSKNGKTLLQQELNEVVFVNEGGRHRRMSKRQAYFKTMANRALKDPRYAALLMKTMEQYDLVKDEQVPTCMRVHFVRARRAEDDHGSA